MKLKEPDLQIFSAEDETNLMAERDTLKARVSKLQERWLEAENRLIKLCAKVRDQEGDLRAFDGRSLDTNKRAAQAEKRIRKIQQELHGFESRACEASSRAVAAERERVCMDLHELLPRPADSIVDPSVGPVSVDGRDGSADGLLSTSSLPSYRSAIDGSSLSTAVAPLSSIRRLRLFRRWGTLEPADRPNSAVCGVPRRTSGDSSFRIRASNHRRAWSILLVRAFFFFVVL